MTTFKIHPIVMGTKVFDKGMMTYQHDYGKPYTIPIYSWYLEGGDTAILVDTGEMSPVISTDREKAIGGKIYTFEAGLARWGLAPEDIGIIIHTHLHNDHCENDYKCPHADIYVHVRELESIHAPHPLDYRYLEDYIEDVEENGQIKPVQRDGEIVPGIRVMHTPAHPRAHPRRADGPGGHRGRHRGYHRILRDPGKFYPTDRDPRHGNGGHPTGYGDKPPAGLRHHAAGEIFSRHPTAVA